MEPAGANGDGADLVEGASVGDEAEAERAAGAKRRRLEESAAAATAAAAAFSASVKAVLKLFVVSAEPNFAQPWQVRPQRSSTGSAFVLDGRRIVTNAHVVASAKTVYARRSGVPKKFPCRVLCCGHTVDLALLAVDDEAFWQDLPPLELVDVPPLQSSVCVCGYPTGGDSLSVTAGVISRVDMRSVGSTGTTLLTVQIDAAINPGNSGGPAFSDVRQGEVIGVAFSKLRSADNIGYIIPSVIVRHFLDEYSALGSFSGPPGRGFSWQRMENAFLREKFGTGDEKTGILIAKIDPLAPCSKVLRSQDVVLSADGEPIADDGTVAWRGEERVEHTHLFRLHHNGDTIRLRVLRRDDDGEIREISLDVELGVFTPLVPYMHSVTCFPSYFVVAGLVFIPLSLPFLEHAYGPTWRKSTPVKLLSCIHEFCTFQGEQVVVLFQILSADINYGYKGQSLYVRSFNGEPVRNLKHMAEMVDACTDKWLVWEFDQDNTFVLDREAAAREGPAILAEHAIPADRSPDLRG